MVLAMVMVRCRMSIVWKHLDIQLFHFKEYIEFIALLLILTTVVIYFHIQVEAKTIALNYPLLVSSKQILLRYFATGQPFQALLNR